jgi:N-dimethylarginine dimethylaminohydrolase
MFDKSKKILMVRPDFYRVDYEINPWMTGNINRADAELSKQQWHAYYNQLSKLADVQVLVQHEDVPDMVFAANGGFVLDGVAINSNFRYAERKPETAYFDEWFEANGFETVHLPEDLWFEGAGDALVDLHRDLV